jgi:hypothetical protein
MVKTAYLFFDLSSMSRELARAYMASINVAFNRPIEGRAINFFSSTVEDLALISKYRVVTLPTLVMLNDKNKLVFRMVNSLPVAQTITFVDSPDGPAIQGVSNG